MSANLKLLPQAERLLSGTLSAYLSATALTMTVNNPPLITKLPTYLELDYANSAAEVVRVINVSGNDLTIERGINLSGVGVEHIANTNYKQKITSVHWDKITSAIEEGWLTEDTSYTFTRVSTSSFKITAATVDRTATYGAGRLVRINGTVLVTIVSSSFTTPDTTVVVNETTVPATITSIELEISPKTAYDLIKGYIASRTILPKTTDIYDLGSALKKFKDLYLSGNANVTGSVISKTDTLVKPFLVIGLSGAVDYLCDGTADDVQIQAALDACNVAGGGIVFIKEGTYDISAVLTIYSNTTFCGEGWSSILKSADNFNNRLIYAGSRTNVVIKDLQIDMNRANNTTISAKAAITLISLTNSLIENIYLHDMRWGELVGNTCTGISLTDGTNVIIRNNYLSYMPDYGIAIGGANQCQVINNYIHNVTNHAINVNVGAATNARTTKCVISGNIIYFDSDVTKVASGFKVDQADYCEFSNNIIYFTGNATATTGYHGFFNSSDSRTADATANAYYCDNNTYSNNIIYNFQFGLYLKGNRQFSVTNNYIYENDLASAYGIYMDTDERNDSEDIFCDKGKINGNTIIYPSTTTLGNAYAIALIRGNYCKISNNFINYAPTNGIFTGTLVAPACQPIGLEICNNTVLNSGNNNINAYCTYSAINNNVCMGAARSSNGSYAEIFLDVNSVYNTVNGNQCYCNAANKAKYCIRESVTGANYNIIIGNMVQGGVTANILVNGANTEIGHNLGY